ncbi:MAG: class I SAM-dependent methyltransferase [Candidatus Kapabacteria bacterium]|nr:class I SAM-dependent methyltransferase [Candidatus Kapabacteria bacterium]
MHFPTYSQQTDSFLRSTGCHDYVRYASIALAAKRIQAEGVDGAVAECGVWRGDLSEFLQHCLPERELYLFDTFEGFSHQNPEVRNNDARFRDTSAESVHRRLGNSPFCHIRKGFFPDTAQGLESATFSLVMLDFDIYEATRDALNFFYPLMPRGGYVFIHDCNSPEYDGACRKAVAEFLYDKPELVLDMPDLWGTMYFRKL